MTKKIPKGFIKCEVCYGTGHIPHNNAMGLMLKRLRTLDGLTLDQLARRVGITKGYLSHIELGRRICSAQLFSKIILSTGPAPRIKLGPNL